MTVRDQKSSFARKRSNDDGPRNHLALRIPASTRVSGKLVRTVALHNEHSKRFGSVLFAKFGAPIASKTLQILNDQIRERQQTLLIVVSKVGKSFTAHQAPLASVFSQHPSSEHERFVPDYYKKLGQVTSAWFRLDGPFVDCNLERFRLSSTKRTLLDVVTVCRTPAMLVEEF